MTIFFYTHQLAPYMIHRWEMISAIYPNLNVLLTKKPDKCRPWNIKNEKYKFNLFSFPDLLKFNHHISFSPGLLNFIKKKKNNQKSIHIFEDISGLNAFLITFFNKNDNFYLLNDGGFIENTYRLSQFIKWRFIGKKCKAAMSPGDFGRRYMIAWGFPKEKIFNSFLSPDVTVFNKYLKSESYFSDRKMVRNIYNIDDNEIVLFVNSRLLDWKRIIDLYDALFLLDKNYLSKISVLLLGDGPDKTTLNKFKSQNLFKFIWLGQVEYHDIYKYYASSDIFIHPSIGDIWGLVINEALLMGKPVICTNVIGAADLIINDYNGYKIDEKAPKQLSLCIKKIINNSDLRTQLSKNALNIRYEWNSQLFLNEFTKMINI